MTALWGSLIVLGIMMIAFAVWPSIRSRKTGEESGPTGGEAAAVAAEKDAEGFRPGP